MDVTAEVIEAIKLFLLCVLICEKCE
jgi:hypothetical protein